MAHQYQQQDNFILKGTPENTSVTLKAGQGVVLSRTPIVLDGATGTYIKSTPTKPATHITMFDVDTDSSNTKSQAYKAGDFNIKLVHFPTGVDTLGQKLAHIANPAISVDEPYHH